MEIHSDHIREGVAAAISDLQESDNLPTLRDRFAMAALEALLQSSDNQSLSREPRARSVVAERAYGMADAMLEFRKKDE